MCWRLGCRFRDIRLGRSIERDSSVDGYTRLLVIGASGMTGRAVVEAAVACVWFKVVAFTRNSESLADLKHVKNGNVSVVKGDMLDVKSLNKAMSNVDVVFFTTAYWDTMDSECEYTQGVNVMNAAERAKVKHLLYVGTPYTQNIAKEPCHYLVGRERVQSALVKSNLPFTILHMGFYYENLMSVFRPHRVEPLTYAVALPMGNVPLNCGSVLDFAHCIAKIILQPKLHIGLVIKLSTGYHTVTQLAAWLDRHFDNLNFYDPRIPLEQYRRMKFDGIEELSAMFLHLQSTPNNLRWDQSAAFRLCPSARSFRDWLVENEKDFLVCLNAETERPTTSDTFDETVETNEMYKEDMASAKFVAEYKKRVNVKAALTAKEETLAWERQLTMCEQVTVMNGFMKFVELFRDLDG